MELEAWRLIYDITIPRDPWNHLENEVLITDRGLHDDEKYPQFFERHIVRGSCIKNDDNFGRSSLKLDV